MQGYFILIIVLIIIYLLVQMSPWGEARSKKPEITVADIPDRHVPLDLFIETGVVTDVKKNMYQGTEIREIWTRSIDGRESSVTLTGHVPVRRGQSFSVVHDRITKTMCGVINHTSGIYYNFVPDISANRYVDVLHRQRFLHGIQSFTISAWGDQNVHVLPRVEQFLLKHL